jgi:hypothetical protein
MEMAALTELREDDAQQLVYCACDFLADRCRRFFPLVSDRRSLGQRLWRQKLSLLANSKRLVSSKLFAFN